MTMRPLLAVGSTFVILALAATTGTNGVSAATKAKPKATKTTKAAAKTATTIKSTASAAPTTVASVAPAAAGSSNKAILLGFKNLEGATFSVPQIRIGFEEAIKYVNENGGVNGRKIELKFCKVDGSPETSIDCANQFVEAKVDASVTLVDPGNDASLKITKGAGIAELVMSGNSAQQQLDIGHSFIFGNPPSASYLAGLLAMSDAGAKKVRFFQDDTPLGRSLNESVLKPTAKLLGMDADTIFYPPTGADWASLMATALAQRPDGIGTLLAQEPGCVAMMTAISQVGFKGPVIAGQCTAYQRLLGARVTGTLTLSDQFTPDALASAPTFKAAKVEIYVDRMTKSKNESLINGFAQQGFGFGVDIADALSQVKGTFDAKSVLAAMPTVKGSRFMSGEYNCDGKQWPNSASCQLNIVVMRAKADGTREVVGKGFLNLAAYRDLQKNA
jgi:branched-chain amino acid transport system substrate-binding protein